jgi:hypothetical protein
MEAGSAGDLPQRQAIPAHSSITKPTHRPAELRLSSAAFALHARIDSTVLHLQFVSCILSSALHPELSEPIQSMVSLDPRQTLPSMHVVFLADKLLELYHAIISFPVISR